MSQSINWDTLETQYLANGVYRDHLAKMVSVVDDSFVAGQQFVKHFHESMTELEHDIKDANIDASSSSSKDEQAIDSMLREAELNQSNTSASCLCDNNVGRISIAANQTEPMEGSASTSIVYNSLKDAGNVLSSVISDSSTKLMDLILPTDDSKNTIAKNGRHGHFGPIDTTIVNWWERDALQFMRGMMDECTHLKNFSVPFDTDLYVI